MTLVGTINTSRYAYPSETIWADDGYEFMEKTRKEAGWHDVPSWGSDGWDLGSWPLVLVQHRNPKEGVRVTWDVLYYVEGDVTIYEYTTLEERTAKTDELAVFHWLWQNEEWVQGLDVDRGAIDMSKVPEHLKGPFSWERAESTKEG